VAPHVGRGGWTWYTGSAGWLYRLVVETLLGVNREGDQLRLTPRLRAEWPSYKVHYRFRETVYHITITRNTDDSAEGFLTLDGQRQTGATIALVDDRREHFAELTVR
jgi:cellobiose phosphorylase